MRGRLDTELVVLARAASSEAAGALFDRYWVLAWRTAYAVTADRRPADDSAQEAFVKALAALGRFDETQPFAPWLKRIAINAVVDSLRRSRRLEVVHDEESTFHTLALGESAEDDLHACVRGEGRADALRASPRWSDRAPARPRRHSVGLASFTDRVLPHLFPTVDERVFRDTAVNSMGDRAAASLDVVRYERDDARRARGRA